MWRSIFKIDHSKQKPVSHYPYLNLVLFIESFALQSLLIRIIWIFCCSLPSGTLIVRTASLYSFLSCRFQINEISGSDADHIAFVWNMSDSSGMEEFLWLRRPAIIPNKPPRLLISCIQWSLLLIIKIKDSFHVQIKNRWDRIGWSIDLWGAYVEEPQAMIFCCCQT